MKCSFTEYNLLCN